MFHARLLELESELIAKEEAERGLTALVPECAILLDSVENEIGVRLADKSARDWKGWLCYRRGKDSMIVCRGRAFDSGGLSHVWHVGFDVRNGAESIGEYHRHLDVTPPQDLDHLLINFGAGKTTRVFLWYGENIAPYRLIFEADIDEDPEKQLKDAIVDACIWILTKPKHLTLPEFLATQSKPT